MQNFNPFEHAANPVVAIINMFNEKRLKANLSTYAYEVAIKHDEIEKYDEKLIEFVESLNMISSAPFNLSTSDFQVFTNRDTENIDLLVVVKDLFVTSQKRFFIVYGSLKSNKEFKEKIQAVIPKSTLVKVTTINCDQKGVISESIKTINTYNINKAHEEFYPFEGFDNLIKTPKDFVDSKQNLAIFIGPPGTGKSTLLRNIICSISDQFEKVIVCSSPKAYEQPDFYSTITENVDGRTLIILEDAATAIAKREDENLAMHELLNKLDGIIESKDKIIISTNLSNLKSVDEAVYRPGRCYGVFQTKLLTPDQANVARAVVGKEHIELTKEISLSAALNYDNNTNVDHLKGSIAFVP